MRARHILRQRAPLLASPKGLVRTPIINFLAGLIKRARLKPPHLVSMTQITSADAVIDLPPPDTERRTVRRKAAVVQAVRLGLISLEEASLHYALSVEELFGWQRAVERHGIHGLRVTRPQIYRDTEEPRSTKGRT